MTVKFSKDAREQIRSIRAYSQLQWGKEVADLYARNLRVTMVETLDRRPTPGLSRDGDLGEGIFSFPCASHMIYYRLIEGGIIVIGVLHQSQDPQTRLGAAQPREG